jgi:hypothetical protein
LNLKGFFRQWQTTPGAPDVQSGLAVAMTIGAALVVLSFLASILFIKPCARGEGGVRIDAPNDLPD